MEVLLFITWNSVTSIEYDAFDGCSSLKLITIPFHVLPLNLPLPLPLPPLFIFPPLLLSWMHIELTLSDVQPYCSSSTSFFPSSTPPPQTLPITYSFHPPPSFNSFFLFYCITVNLRDREGRRRKEGIFVYMYYGGMIYTSPSSSYHSVILILLGRNYREKKKEEEEEGRKIKKK